MIKAFFLAALISVYGSPVLAQRADPSHSVAEHGGDARSDRNAANTRHKPTTKQVNRAYGTYYQSRAQARAQDRRDRRAYKMAVGRARHNRAVNRNDRRYARQQTAYASAMAAWRRQVYACKHNDRRACKAPSPRVADFY